MTCLREFGAGRRHAALKKAGRLGGGRWRQPFAGTDSCCSARLTRAVTSPSSPHAVDHLQLVVARVEIRHRSGLLGVDRQPLAHRVRVVIGAAFGLEADLAAADDRLVRHVQLDHRIERLAQLRQQLVKRSSLGQIARIAVQDEAVGRIGLRQPLLQHAEQDIVGDQLAGIHHGLGLASHRAAGGHRGAQHVASRDMRYAQRRLQPGRLRTFARAGCTK